MKRYLISMAIRTACVILAVVVSGPLRWIFIVGAVILPYIAVVMANAGGERRQTPEPAPAPQWTALPAEARPFDPADEPRRPVNGTPGSTPGGTPHSTDDHRTERPGGTRSVRLIDESGAEISSSERVIPGSNEYTG